MAIDEMVVRGQLPLPDYIKIDVEGAESEVLEGANATLEKAHPTIFLSTRGSTVHERCCRLLRTLGYRLEPMDGKPIQEAREVLATWRD